MSRASASCLHLAIALLAGLGCGSGIAGDGGDDGGDDGGSCEMAFSVSPERPTRGDEVQLTANVYHGAQSGFETYGWIVRFAGEPIEIPVADQQVIEFTAEQAGVYSVELQGSVGGATCIDDSRDLNVQEPGAQFEPFRLRAIPPADDPLLPPPQDIEVQLYGGAADYSVGEIGLVPGTQVTGTSRGQSGGPVAAYLRARRVDGSDEGAPLYVEAFAGDDGEYSMRLLSGEHELLVIPDDPALLPYRLPTIAAEALPEATQVTTGDPIAVTVETGPGTPVAGARVSLVVDGVPSSVAITDSTGASTLQVGHERPESSSVSVTVVPPEGAGLPLLELAAVPAVDLTGGAVAIRYASLASREVSPAVRLTGGGPAGGSRVTWIARALASAGTISIGGPVHQATGQVRVTAAVAANGTMAATLLPEAVYDAIVEPPAGVEDAVSVTVVDLRDAAPAQLELAAPAFLRGQLLAPGPEPVAIAGARVQASPRNLLVGAASAGASARTDEQGRFALAVAGGGDYEITADATSLRQGRVRLLVTAPAPGGDLDVALPALPPVLRATGVLGTQGGGPVAGAHLQLYCFECGPDGASIPVAETVTDSTGRFLLIAPNPGVAPPE